MVYNFFDKKIGSQARVRVYEVPAQELQELVIEKLKTRKSTQGLKIMFVLQI